MVIAWTYLLHAYFRTIGVDYRHFRQVGQRKRFEKTRSGAHKHWDLRRCINHPGSPLDRPTAGNLEFLIGLRNEIEHRHSHGLAKRFSSRYLACCLNFERYICELFGQKQSVASTAAFTLQFRDFVGMKPDEAPTPLPANVKNFVDEFDGRLTDEIWNSPYFRRKYLFLPVVVGKRGQADEVIEFYKPSAELASSIADEHGRIVIREVERSKFTPTEIVDMMKAEGFIKFRIHEHTTLWQARDAKKPGYGFGVSVGGRWFWYERWIPIVRNYCEERWGVEIQEVVD